MMLTDTIFWFIIVPLLAIKDYELSFVSSLTSSTSAIKTNLMSLESNLSKSQVQGLEQIY